MKLDLKTITLVLSLLLNALGGTGVVHPLVGGASDCSQASPAPAK